MNCREHDNGAMAHCPSCLAEYWKMTAAEYKQDAERYRFFIKHLDLTDQLSPLHILMSKIGDRTPTKVELDAAIDKAMEQTK